MERLIHERSIALGLALDASSHATYDSALNSYLNFCSIHAFPVEPSSETLSFFVVFMSHHIEPRSVAAYLSGICSKLESHFPGVRTARNSMLVKRTLAGCKRLRSKPIHRKSPLSRDHLLRAGRSLSDASTHDDLLFVCMLWVGFLALLRLGELTFPDNVSLQNPRKLTRRSSLEFVPGGLAFWLPTHKADRTFEGSRIVVLERYGLPLLVTFQRYLASRDTLAPVNPYLWVNSEGRLPKRSWFLRRLRVLEPDRQFAGQSMRAGGATALAEDGTPPHLIQASGRWASEAFQMYIRKNPFILQALLFNRRPAA